MYSNLSRLLVVSEMVVGEKHGNLERLPYIAAAVSFFQSEVSDFMKTPLKMWRDSGKLRHYRCRAFPGFQSLFEVPLITPASLPKPPEVVKPLFGIVILCSGY